MIDTLDDLSIYVINLRRRVDRREWMRAQLNGLDATYTSDWHGPYDGLVLSRASLESAGYGLFDWQLDSDNPWWNRPLKYGEIGCTLSHLACWAHAAASGSKYTLILEDDAVLVPDFRNRLEEAMHSAHRAGGFDLLYLGRFPLEPDLPAGPGLAVPGYSHCTFAYLLAATALPALLDARLGQAIVPVDEFLPAMYIEHPRLDVRRRFPRQLTAFACDPPLVAQLPKMQAGSDTEDSPYVEDPIVPHDQSGIAAEAQGRHEPIRPCRRAPRH
jgi:glycosyl transferase family 25